MQIMQTRKLTMHKADVAQNVELCARDVLNSKFSDVFDSNQHSTYVSPTKSKLFLRINVSCASRI